ncbi:hypothetical protein [Paraliomyxa miuraensis]|uniref:hypothetical protein n=1 Tax=Paraliomyxa miuraensis TaxID=376150 RepID=UPI00225929D3|nr:hypothetical protein [Paraliomyxa miuraensis]MCX4247935.1 hypothetical protein [Paraliomyxa miuraensis]
MQALEASSETTATGSSGTSADATTEPLDPTGYEDDGATGCSFTCPPPPPPPVPEGWPFECDLLVQDCPEGHKCVPYTYHADLQWVGTVCVRVPEEPDLPGEPCMVEDHVGSSRDSCDRGAICWQVDPTTLEGVCHSLCDILDGVLACDSGLDCAQLSFVPLCVEPCDPLTPSCPRGQACTFAGSALTCQPVPLAGATEGEMCHPWSIPCVDGSLCSFDPALDCLRLPGAGCCAAPCDMNTPKPCEDPASICVPWFTVDPPPDLAHLGVCVVPRA